MVLPQRDLVDAQAPQARVDRAPQVLGTAVERPLPRVRADVAGLGRQGDVVAQAALVEQPGDQALVGALCIGSQVAGSVGVRGVEQRDARVDGGAHGVGELLPRLVTGLVEGHQSETDRPDLDASHLVTAERSCLHEGAFPPCDDPETERNVS